MNELYQRLTEDHEFLPFDCGDQDRYDADKDNPESNDTYAMYFDLSSMLRQ